MLLFIALTVLIFGGCKQHDSSALSLDATAEEKSLNLYNWADYIGPDTVSSFEKKTGIKVHVAYYDSNETLRTRMLAGHSGFDVTVPSATFIQQETRSGAYLELDRGKIPNLRNLDPEIMTRVASNDPGNAHSAVYLWGTIGIGYNEKLSEKALPGFSPASWKVIFDPDSAAKLANCGINFIDEPTGVVELVLKYLSRDPANPSAEDFAEAEQVLKKIRPYVRNIDTSGEIDAMANGDICVSLAYNGDMVQARNRAAAAKNGIRVNYSIPNEGSLMWFTLLAIPSNAPHAANAHLFIDYVMNAQVIAGISNAVGYANAVPDSARYLDASIGSDPIIYPAHDILKKMYVVSEGSAEQSRAITRLWQRFKTGR